MAKTDKGYVLTKNETTLNIVKDKYGLCIGTTSEGYGSLIGLTKKEAQEIIDTLKSLI